MQKPKQVKISFKFTSPEKLLEGRKTATTRTRRFGKPGDWFQAYGATFRLYHVEPVNLHLVKQDFYKQEGFETPEEFMDCWVSIHPKKGWDGGQQVYLHLFERTDRTNEQGTGQAGIPFED